MIKIIAVGKVKEKYFTDGINEYLKRIQPYSKIEVIEVNDIGCSAQASLADMRIVMDKEGEAILSKIDKDEYVIVLDLHGKEYSSEEISKKIEDSFTYHSSKLTFVIAGSLGFGSRVIERSNLRWSLSKCTFPHQMVRLMLVEQIYRAYKIAKNEIYHK